MARNPTLSTNSTHTYRSDDFDKYESYEEEFNPTRVDRKARKKRKPKQVPTPLRVKEHFVDEVADDASWGEGRIEMTYRPAKHETAWLFDSLRSFFEEHVITDVLAMVKGGKEASVYRCQADPSTGAELLAAKVYRPQMFRALSNEAMYRQGRAILTADKHQVHANMDRVMRAVGKKTAFGRQVSHTSWLMHEFIMLDALHKAGGAIPKPVAVGDNAIIMGYVGDAESAGPTLSEVRLDRDEAVPLFKEVMRNVKPMLDLGWLHGDLSAYNILYWEGEITLIDFPQVTSVHNNSQAHFILQRDVERVCEYFIRQGVKCHADRIVADLWKRYGYMHRARMQDNSIDEEGNVARLG